MSESQLITSDRPVIVAGGWTSHFSPDAPPNDHSAPERARALNDNSALNDNIRAEEVREALSLLLRSPDFRASDRNKRLLFYVVEETRSAVAPKDSNPMRSQSTSSGEWPTLMEPATIVTEFDFSREMTDAQIKLAKAAGKLARHHASGGKPYESLTVGESLLVGRDVAVKMSGSNRPHGKQYSLRFQAGRPNSALSLPIPARGSPIPGLTSASSALSTARSRTKSSPACRRPRAPTWASQDSPSE